MSRCPDKCILLSTLVVWTNMNNHHKPNKTCACFIYLFVWFFFFLLKYRWFTSSTLGIRRTFKKRGGRLQHASPELRYKKRLLLKSIYISISNKPITMEHTQIFLGFQIIIQVLTVLPTQSVPILKHPKYMYFL